MQATDRDYLMRVKRTKSLQKVYSEDIEVMLASFVPCGWTVSIEQSDREQPGFPFAEHTHYIGTLHDKRENGSDAHIFVCGYTIDDVRCRLLGLIMSNKGFFPYT